MPKRPLSAYNLFFQQQRRGMLGSSYTPSQDKSKRKHRKTHGKVSFADMARIISQRWKNLDPQARQELQDQAARNKAEYNEALKQFRIARANRAMVQAQRPTSPRTQESATVLAALGQAPSPPTMTPPPHPQRYHVSQRQPSSPPVVVTSPNASAARLQQPNPQYVYMVPPQQPNMPSAAAYSPGYMVQSQPQMGRPRVAQHHPPHQSSPMSVPTMTPATPYPPRQPMVSYPSPYHASGPVTPTPSYTQRMPPMAMITPPHPAANGPARRVVAVPQQQVLVVTPDGRTIGTLVQPAPPPVVLVQHPSGQLTYAPQQRFG